MTQVKTSVGTAIIHKNLIIKYKLPEYCYIYMTEVTEIFKTMENINKFGKIHKNKSSSQLS